MSGAIDLAQLEHQLRNDLEASERRLKEATSEQQPRALAGFLQALQSFTEYVLDGKLPKGCRYARRSKAEQGQ
jgi:hypothetical protein